MCVFWEHITNAVDFALEARMITSSAILPTDHLDQAVNELSNMLPQELEPLLRNISYRDVVSTQSSTDER